MYLKRNKATKEEIAATLEFYKKSYESIRKNIQENKPTAYKKKYVKG